MPIRQSTPKDKLELELPSTIPPEFEGRLLKALETYTFHLGGRLRQTLAVEHDIQILDPHPFREPSRRQSIPKRKYFNEQLREAKVFVTLELKSGYWQIPMAADAKKYTVFSAPSAGSIKSGLCLSASRMHH